MHARYYVSGACLFRFFFVKLRKCAGEDCKWHNHLLTGIAEELSRFGFWNQNVYSFFFFWWIFRARLLSPVICIFCRGFDHFQYWCQFHFLFNPDIIPNTPEKNYQHNIVVLDQPFQTRWSFKECEKKLQADDEHTRMMKCCVVFRTIIFFAWLSIFYWRK